VKRIKEQAKAQSNTRKYLQAIQSYEDAIKVASQISDFENRELYRIYWELGKIYTYIEKYEKAITEWKKIQIDNKDPLPAVQPAELYQSFAEAYIGHLHNYKLGIEYAEKELEAKIKIHGQESAEIGIVYNRLSVCHEMLENIDRAIEYSKKSLELFNKDKNKLTEQANAEFRLGNLYAKIKTYALSFQHYKNYLNMVIKRNVSDIDREEKLNRAKAIRTVYLNSGEVDEEIENLLKKSGLTDVQSSGKSPEKKIEFYDYSFDSTPRNRDKKKSLDDL